MSAFGINQLPGTVLPLILPEQFQIREHVTTAWGGYGLPPQAGKKNRKSLTDWNQ